MALSSKRTSSCKRTVASSSWLGKFTFSIPPKEKGNPKYVVAKDVSAFVAAAAAYVNFRIECANEEDHAGAGPHGHGKTGITVGGRQSHEFRQRRPGP